MTTSSSTCTFTNSRGAQLSARIDRPVGEVLATAVFAHCFTCSKDLKVERRIVEALAATGIAVLSFDFAGLGRSTGEFAETFSGDVEDLIAASDYLAEHLEAPSLLVGHSLGGAAILMAAGRVPSVAAVVTIAAPADPGHVVGLFADDIDTIERDGQAKVTISGREFLVRGSFVDDLRDQRLLEQLGTLKAAKLFFHSPQDNTVGVENARLLYDAAKHPKSFISLDGANHLLTDEADAAYVASVTAAWAARYLNLTPAARPYEPAGAVARNDGGIPTRVTSRGFAMIVDEPIDVGGLEQGPTPYDHLATALAACTSMTLRMYADRKEMALESAVTEVTHDRVHAKDCQECDHAEGRIDVLRRVVTLTGDLSDDDRARLMSIADRCPVHRTLEGQLEVHTTAG